jgi:hypothetical protein
MSLLSKEVALLGSAFAQRAGEAAACHQAGNYLACCAMCGAAAESAILSAACTNRDEAIVLREYVRRNGRRRVLDMVFNPDDAAERRFTVLAFDLLAHWRDEAAHGIVSNISELDAYHALTTLLRLAQFLSSNWTKLSGTATRIG